MTPQFGVMLYPDQPLSVLIDRISWLESLRGETLGRIRPTSIRRSYTLFGPWDPRAGRYTYEEVFANFGAIGISDFVLDWPDDADRDTFEAAARDALPAWRRGA